MIDTKEAEDYVISELRKAMKFNLHRLLFSAEERIKVVKNINDACDRLINNICGVDTRGTHFEVCAQDNEVVISISTCNSIVQALFMSLNDLLPGSVYYNN